MEFFSGISEVQDILVKYPSVCCITLEDMWQVVKIGNNVVDGRVVKVFRLFSLVLEVNVVSLVFGASLFCCRVASSSDSLVQSINRSV